MHTPTKIEPYSPTEILILWNDGSQFTIPYLELRYACPCAACVDEKTGRRTLQKGTLSPQIKPLQVLQVGRYAIQIQWSDQHETGIYHYDRLFELCKNLGTTH